MTGRDVGNTFADKIVVPNCTLLHFIYIYSFIYFVLLYVTWQIHSIVFITVFFYNNFILTHTHFKMWLNVTHPYHVLWPFEQTSSQISYIRSPQPIIRLLRLLREPKSMHFPIEENGLGKSLANNLLHAYEVNVVDLPFWVLPL